MLKKLLLIGAVIAIVPMDRENQQAVYDVARATVTDLAGFCQRNPEVCNRSSIVVDQLIAKAKFAGGLVLDLAQRTAANDDPVNRLIDREGLPVRPYDREPAGYDDAPSPMAGESRFPAYTEQRTSDSRVVGTLRGDELPPSWRGAAR
jgi:hypothetical protein